MKTFIFFLAFLALSGAVLAQSPKMSHKKASSNHHLAKETGKAKHIKVKQSYKSNKFHSSHKAAPDNNDVTVDKSLKNAIKAKKHNNQHSDKHQQAQAEYLKQLNQNNRYKTSKINSGEFGFY